MRQLEGGRSSPALPPGLDAPKKRFKTAMHAMHAAEDDLKTATMARGGKPLASGPLDAETEAALDLVAQRDGERVATLRSRRAAAAKEVNDAEHALLRVKTAVEDAEAIYNNVRADIAAGHHHDAHAEDDEAHAEDDWDKYLHFGEGHHGGEEGGDDKDGADGDKKPPSTPRDPEAVAAAEAAAAAATAMAEDANQGGSPPVQSPEAAAAMQGAVAAAVRVAGGGAAAGPGPSAGAGPGPAGATEADAAAERGLRGGVDNPHHHRFQPSLAEAEQFLLSELKKLEAANARLMSARHALAELDRQLGEAVARAEENAATAARRRALAAVAGGGGDASRDASGDASGEDGDDEDGTGSRGKGVRGDGGANAGPSGNGSAGGAGSAGVSGAARRSSAAGGGGKVIEDRRFGIYDSRRYRMEGEPAPPDPSDDEDAAGRSASVRGRGASANAGKKKEEKKEAKEEKKKMSAKMSAVKEEQRAGKKKGGAGVSADAEARPPRAGGRGATAGGRGGGRTGSTGRRIEPASASTLRAAERDGKHAGFQFKKEAGARGEDRFAAPSAADAATYVARGGGSLRWRMKRPRTRSAVGRPATGPTSWAATCAFALWRGGELAAAKRASAARAAEEHDDEEEDEDDANSDEARDSDARSDENDAESDSDADEDERRKMFETARADAASPGFGLGEGWVEDDIVFDHFDHFDELAADDDGIVDIGAVMDLGFDE